MLPLNSKEKAPGKIPMRRIGMFLFCLSPGLFTGIAGAQTNFPNSALSQINFSYWNDNFLLEDWVDPFIPKGKDDHVSASFLLEYLSGMKGNHWTYNGKLNVLTSKEDNYRADLLTLSISKTLSVSAFSLKNGLGLVGRGNFGGSEIQNWYHDLFGYPRINLPYLKTTKWGILANSEIQGTFIDIRSFKFSGDLLTTYVTQAGPAKILPSLYFGLQKYIRFQINLGYVNYYKTDRWLAPIFKRGFTWTCSASKMVLNSFSISLWVTEGMYGIKNEFHFGLKISALLKGIPLRDDQI